MIDMNMQEISTGSENDLCNLGLLSDYQVLLAIYMVWQRLGVFSGSSPDF